jgi:hypothetical protein
MSLVAILGVLYLAVLIGWIGYVIFAMAGQVGEEIEASGDPFARPGR